MMAERKELVITSQEFPSNSHKSKEEIVEKRVKSKIVKGNVKKRKKTLGRKVSETFLEDDSSNVIQYILWDVLIPSAKDMISDIIKGGIDMLLFGENKEPSRIHRDRDKSYVSYRSYYERDKRNDRYNRSSSRRSSNNFDDILFESRSEAEEVLDFIVNLIDEYGLASVADFYDLVGMTSHYTDQKWGWYNVNTARVVRCRDGYSIRFPRVEELE